MSWFRQMLPLLFCFVLAACGDSKSPEKTEGQAGVDDDAPVEEDLGGPLAGEPAVEVWDWDQALEAVQAHQGKVVVMHIWATWNESFDTADQSDPMQREEREENLAQHGFDEFVRLKKLLRDDVVAISLNTDYNFKLQDQSPETLKEKVLAFVKDRGANFRHGISSQLDEILLEQLEIPGTPATLVFGKQGKLRKKFFFAEEPHSYREDVIPFVEELIKEPYEPPAPKADADQQANAKGNEQNPSPDEKVTLELGDWDSLQKRVAEAKGRVVVVDLWSTECVPCLKEFPNLVELHNEHSKDVACLSFNLDYIGIGKPEDVKPDVLDVLKKLNATLPNIMSTTADEEIYKKIELASIPAVYVYDRDGKLRKRFDDAQGQFTYEKDILPLVNSLIEEKAE